MRQKLALESLAEAVAEEARPKPPPDERAEVEAALKPVEGELIALRERLKVAQDAVESARSVEERVKHGTEAEALRQLIARAEARAAPLRQRLAAIEAAEQRARLEAELGAVEARLGELRAEARAVVDALNEALQTFARAWREADAAYRAAEREQNALLVKLGRLPDDPVSRLPSGLSVYAFVEPLRWLPHAGNLLQEVLRWGTK